MENQQKPSNMLVCGIHERVPTLPGSKKRKATGSARAFVPGEARGLCLCDYVEYPELLQERLDAMAKEETTTETAQPFRLMDLPAELRLRIYEHALCLPGGVEFCPEPWEFYGTAPPGRDRRAQFDREWKPVTDHHRERHQSLSAAAKLLRASKQIHGEAKPVFYGENEWRFTNTSGWIGLDRFFFQIGIENCKLLRNITIRHPDFTLLPETCAGDNHFWRSLVGIRYPQLKEDKGIFYPSRWYDRPLPEDPYYVLEKIAQLRHLNIVLPWENFQFNAEIVDESKFDNLHITLVSLSEENAENDGQSLAAAVAAEHNANTVPGEKDWEVIETTYDAVGDYEILDQDDDNGGKRNSVTQCEGRNFMEHFGISQ